MKNLIVDGQVIMTREDAERKVMTEMGFVIPTTEEVSLKTAKELNWMSKEYHEKSYDYCNMRLSELREYNLLRKSFHSELMNMTPEDDVGTVEKINENLKKYHVNYMISSYYLQIGAKFDVIMHNYNPDYLKNKSE